MEGFDFHKLGSDFGDKTMNELVPSDAKKVRKLLKQNGLKMKSMYVGKAQDKEGWEKAFELAKSLKIEYLVAEPKREHWDMVDKLAGEYKIKIAFKGGRKYLLASGFSPIRHQEPSEFRGLWGFGTLD